MDFQAASVRFQTALPFLLTIDQLIRDHPGLLSTPFAIEINEDNPGRWDNDDNNNPTPLHFLCKYLASPEMIQAFIDMRGGALETPYDEVERSGPFERLCSRADVLPETIETLCKTNYEVLRTNNDWGTPLHAACDGGSHQAIRFLLNEYPETLSVKNVNEHTPLQRIMLRINPAPVEVVELLYDGFPQALTMTDQENYTSTHLACSYGALPQVVQWLLDRGPENAQVLTNDWFLTVLHLACKGNYPIEILRCLFNLWPVAALVRANVFLWRDEEDHQMLPYHCTLEKEKQDAVEIMTEATKDTACALIECVLGATGNRSAIPVVVIDHLYETLETAIPGFGTSQVIGLALKQTLRPHLTPDLVWKLVDHDNLQELLKEEDHIQSLICGLVRLNKAGRDYVTEDPSNMLRGVRVLESISDMDCFYLHLRENSSSFASGRAARNETAKSRKRKAEEESLE
jgi:hypothetical protein